LAPPGEYDLTSASFGPPESTTQTANRSVQPFCTAHQCCQACLGTSFPLISAPSHGTWAPSNTCFLGPTPVQNPNAISIVSAVFAQMGAECPYTLQWDASSPLKIAPSRGRIWTPSNTMFRGPTRVLNPNHILIGSAIFAGLTSVTDRPHYSVGNNRSHLHT